MDADSGTVTFSPADGQPLQDVVLGSGDLAIGYEGRVIEGELNTSGAQIRLERVFPAEVTTTNTMDGVNRSLVRRAASVGRSDSLGRGDYLPDFALFNQRGEAVFSNKLRERPAVMTFIFTRCGDPKMCPATSVRLAELGQQLQESGREDVRLIAISFDPAYDSPGILRQYGEAFRLNGPSFELLTGDPETIEALMRLVGVRTIEEDGTIVHNLVTLLTDDHGRIVLRQDGSRWSSDAIYGRVQSMER